MGSAVGVGRGSSPHQAPRSMRLRRMDILSTFVTVALFLFCQPARTWADRRGFHAMLRLGEALGWAATGAPSLHFSRNMVPMM